MLGNGGAENPNADIREIVSKLTIKVNEIGQRIADNEVFLRSISPISVVYHSAQDLGKAADKVHAAAEHLRDQAKTITVMHSDQQDIREIAHECFERLDSMSNIASRNNDENASNRRMINWLLTINATLCVIIALTAFFSVGYGLYNSTPAASSATSVSRESSAPTSAQPEAKPGASN